MTHSSSSSDDAEASNDRHNASSTGVSVSTFVGAEPADDDDDDSQLQKATIAPYLISKKDLDRISSIKEVGENVPAGVMAINQLRALGVLRFVPFKPKSHLAAMEAAKLAGDNAAAAFAAAAATATPTAPSETRADPAELLATLRAELADNFVPVVPKAPNSSVSSTASATKPKKKKKSKTIEEGQPASSSSQPESLVCHATFGEGKDYWREVEEPEVEK